MDMPFCIEPLLPPDVDMVLPSSLSVLVMLLRELHTTSGLKGTSQLRKTFLSLGIQI
jgi:hypothetical protein